MRGTLDIEKVRNVRRPARPDDDHGDDDAGLAPRRVR
jgi:hypothetical protein